MSYAQGAMPFSIPRGVDKFTVVGLADTLSGRDQTLLYLNAEYQIRNNDENPLPTDPRVVGRTHIRVIPINARKVGIEAGIPVNPSTIDFVEQNDPETFTAREVKSDVEAELGIDAAPCGIIEKTTLESPVDGLGDRYGVEAVLDSRKRIGINRQFRKLGLPILKLYDLRSVLEMNKSHLPGYDVGHIEGYLLKSILQTNWVFPLSRIMGHRVSPIMIVSTPEGKKDLMQQYLAGKAYGDVAEHKTYPVKLDGISKDISIGILLQDHTCVPFPDEW